MLEAALKQSGLSQEEQTALRAQARAKGLGIGLGLLGAAADYAVQKEQEQAERDAAYRAWRVEETTYTPPPVSSASLEQWQALESWRAGEREVPAAPPQPAAPEKSLWQQGWEWVQEKVVQPVQAFAQRLTEPPNPSGPLFPKLQTATTVLQGAGLLLDRAVFGGRLTQSALTWRERVSTFVHDRPSLQTAANVFGNLIDFGLGLSSQVLDDVSFGLYGRLTGIAWSNGSDVFQSGRQAGRILSNTWGMIETAAGLALAATSVELMPPTAGVTAPCAALTGGGCLALGGAALIIETAGVAAGTALAGHGIALQMRNAGNPLSRADDSTLRYGTNTGDTKWNAEILQRNLEQALDQAKPEGYHTHHIVPSTHRDMQEARKILEKFGIDINQAENGVFLPANIHNGLVNDKRYMAAVLKDLQRATSKDDVIRILQDIGEQLLNGTYPRSGR